MALRAATSTEVNPPIFATRSREMKMVPGRRSQCTSFSPCARRRARASWIAISIALLLVLATLALLGMILIVAVQKIVEVAGEYSEQVADLTKRLFAEMNAHHIQVDQSHLVTELQARLPQIITDAAGTVSALLSSGFLIMIFVVFLLIGRNPRKQRTDIYAEIEATIRGYITTKTIISAATGLIVGLILKKF